MNSRIFVLSIILAAGLIVAVVIAVWFGFASLDWIQEHDKPPAEVLQAWAGVQLMTVAAFVITCVGIFFGFINFVMSKDIEKRAIESVREYEEVKALAIRLEYNRNLVESTGKLYLFLSARRRLDATLFELKAQRMKDKNWDSTDEFILQEITYDVNRLAIDGAQTDAVLKLIGQLLLETVGPELRKFLTLLYHKEYFPAGSDTHRILASGLGLG